MEKLSTENIEKIVIAGGKLGTALGKVFDDGKVDWTDVVHAGDVFSAFQDLTGVDFPQVLPEAKDLDTTERIALSQIFVTHFDLPNDDLEKTIEDGMAIVSQIITVVMSFVEIGKKFKQ